MNESQGTNTPGVSTPDMRSSAIVPKRKSDERNKQTVQFDQVALFQWLARIADDCDNVEQLLKGISEVICCRSECLGLWVTQKGEDKGFNQIYSILTEPGTVEWESFQVVGRRMIKLAANSSQIQSSRVENQPNHQLIVVPVIEGSGINLMIAGYFHRPQEDNPTKNEWLMGIFAQAVANWFSAKKLDKAEIRSRSLNDVVALTAELDKATNMDSAAIILVNQLKKMTQAKQVAFAIAKRNNLPKLLAISDVEAVEHSLDSSRATTQACGQSMLLNEVVVFPDRRKDANPADIVPLRQYCKSNNFDACISLPIADNQGKAIGSILLAVAPKQASEPGYINYLSQLAQMISGHLQVVERANRNLADHVYNACAEKLATRIAKIAMVGAALLLACLLIPWPYKIACNCEIHPVLRRFIAAPHDGVLEKNLVENGDVIHKDQLVAHLGGRQLRIELAGLEAELKGTSKRRAAAMANSQIAEGQIALSEMKKIQSQIDLVNDKLANLEIRSPIAGIVVAGDLEKVEGAPVEMGQTLFEVGPLDKMLAEISVPEIEVPYVQPGMNIRIKLNAYPFRTWNGKVTKIHPKSEIREQESVFVAEVELENTDLSLKPGMKGQAKIVSDAYPIGWNLFHQPFEKLRYWTVW